LARHDFWDLLDLLASFRVSWTSLTCGDTRVLEPVRVAITSIGLRIIVEATRESLEITFYRGDESVFDDEAVLLAHMRDAGAKAAEAPRTIVDLIATMDSLGYAPHAVEHSRYDTVMLTFITPTTLVELDFFDDHIEYSVFEKQAAPATWEELAFELDLFRGE
jgi:hypothetical protein